MLSRLRKLVFGIRSRSQADRIVEQLRRVNRLARLMAIMQRGAIVGKLVLERCRERQVLAPVIPIWRRPYRC